jgi:hypothetical protein
LLNSAGGIARILFGIGFLGKGPERLLCFGSRAVEARVANAMTTAAEATLAIASRFEDNTDLTGFYER